MILLRCRDTADPQLILSRRWDAHPRLAIRSLLFLAFFRLVRPLTCAPTQTKMVYYLGREVSQVGRISNPATTGRIGNPAYNLSCRGNKVPLKVRSPLNREEAEKALGLIRNVIQNTREDLVAHNWGLLWLIHSFTNAAACLAGWYIESQDLGVFWYLLPLACAGLFNIITVAVLSTRDQGVRSYVQWQIHGIWVTFIVFTAAFALVMHLSHTDPKLFGSVFCLTSGISFAMMQVVFSRQTAVRCPFPGGHAGCPLPAGSPVGADRPVVVGGHVPARAEHVPRETAAYP